LQHGSDTKLLQASVTRDEKSTRMIDFGRIINSRNFGLHSFKVVQGTLNLLKQLLELNHKLLYFY